MKRYETASHRGFTLVEVLVAMFVMSVMAAMAWQGVDGIVRAREASRERLDRTLRLQTVLTQWEQDLGALHDSRVVPALGFDGATVRLTRRVDAGVQLVAWAVRSDGWWRWASPATTRAADLQQQWLASQQLLGNETGQLQMLDSASRWQVYFFRGNAWTNAQSSGDAAAPQPPAPGASAPVAPRQTLPSGVRIVLTFNNDAALTRDVALGPQRQ